MIRPLAYVCGQAKILEGENEKLCAYVNHNVLLGSIREKIIRKMIRDDVPDKYSLSTGIIRSHNETSNQTDIILHSTFENKPLYHYEDVVVLAAEDVSATIEVKSKLKKDKFVEFTNGYDKLINMISSDRELRTGYSFQIRDMPTFGYFLNGATFTFCLKLVKEAYARSTFTANNGEHVIRWMNLPRFFCNQQRRYIFMRNWSTCFMVEFPETVVVDGTSYSGAGLVYGVFSDILHREINIYNGQDMYDLDAYIPRLYNAFIHVTKRVYITDDLICHEGDFRIREQV